MSGPGRTQAICWPSSRAQRATRAIPAVHRPLLHHARQAAYGLLCFDRQACFCLRERCAWHCLLATSSRDQRRKISANSDCGLVVRAPVGIGISARRDLFAWVNVCFAAHNGLKSCHVRKCHMQTRGSLGGVLRTGFQSEPPPLCLQSAS
jgi:hypothetical protein